MSDATNTSPLPDVRAIISSNDEDRHADIAKKELARIRARDRAEREGRTINKQVVQETHGIQVDPEVKQYRPAQTMQLATPVLSAPVVQQQEVKPIVLPAPVPVVKKRDNVTFQVEVRGFQTLTFNAWYVHADNEGVLLVFDGRQPPLEPIPGNQFTIIYGGVKYPVMALHKGMEGPDNCYIILCIRIDENE